MQKKDFYSFFNQAKYLAGARALEHIPVDLKSYDAVRPLVLATKDVTRQGLKKTFIKAFYDSDITLGGFYDDIIDTAGIDQIRDLMTLFHDRGCDSIIAVGRGAVMNAAKGLNMAVSTGVTDILSLAGENTLKTPLKPFFAVPTAGACGYDMANIAVIEQRVFKSDYLFPEVVCLDPRMTAVTDIQKTVESAFVALSHAMEASETRHQNPLNDAYSLAAIQFIHENLPVTLKRPGSKHAALALAYASAMAAAAFSNAPSGVVHNLGSSLAQLTGLKPGLCMGIILPNALRYKIEKKIPVRDELVLAQAGIDVYSQTPEKIRAAKAVEILGGLTALAGKYIPASLAGLKIPGYILEDAARKAESEDTQGFTYNDYMSILTMSGMGLA